MEPRSKTFETWFSMIEQGRRTAAAQLAEDEVKAQLESRRLPCDSLIQDDDETFLRRRAEVIAARTVRLAEGENV